jgi:hypothetical protein
MRASHASTWPGPQWHMRDRSWPGPTTAAVELGGYASGSSLGWTVVMRSSNEVSSCKNFGGQCSKATVAPPRPRASSRARGQQRRREEPHRPGGWSMEEDDWKLRTVKSSKVEKGWRGGSKMKRW